MLSANDLNKVSGLIESFKPKVTYFETDILIPAIIGRLDYVAKTFEGFKQICANTDVARHIDLPLRSLVDPRALDLGAPVPEVGQKYLAEVSRQCDEEFIKPIQELLAKHPKDEVLKTISGTTNFLNEANILFHSILSCKSTLMRYSVQTFPVVKNMRTGEELLGEAKELSMILMPFEVRLNEMQNVISTSIQSIDKWAEQIGVQKTKHVELISNLSVLKSTVWNFRIQVAVVLVSIALFWLSYRANLFLEKVDLQENVVRLRQEEQAHKDAEKKLMSRIQELESATAFKSDRKSTARGTHK